MNRGGPAHGLLFAVTGGLKSIVAFGFHSVFVRMAAIAILVGLVVGNCVTIERRRPIPPARTDDRIVIGGALFHTGTRVVLWNQPGGFNAYLQHRWADPRKVLPSNPADGCDTPERYGVRPFLMDEDGNAMVLSPTARRARLRAYVHQIVLHYDAAGTSRRCFEVLQDERGLSAHFLLDVDGVLYQTLDVAERARHAGPANDRSVGIEIANIGAYPNPAALAAARKRSATPGKKDRPQTPVTGYVQGRRLHQFRFTDAQYRALIRLIRTLRRALPGIKAVYPESADGGVATTVLPPGPRKRFSGVLGHYHVSPKKVDPGPAFDWNRVLRGIQH